MARKLTRRQEGGDPLPTEFIQIITDDRVRLTDIRKLGAIAQVRFRVEEFKEDGAPALYRNCQQFGNTIEEGSNLKTQLAPVQDFCFLV